MQFPEAPASDPVPALPSKPSLGRITLFASGDFACNLYWQSLSFFLLFFYTDALRLSPAVAGLVLLVGSIWDGIADLLVGIHAERSRRDYRWFLTAGAVPLGLGFVLLYVAPPLEGAALAAAVLALHLLFRALYAFVNIPYSAMTARITGDSSQRAQISGLRMLFGTAAALVVALGTERIAVLAPGGLAATGSYLAAALLFGVVGAALLLVVGRGSPAARGQGQAGIPVLAAMRVLVRNRAFVTLNLAMAGVGMAATALTRSVLYYFHYVVGDAAGGPAALAMMGFAGAVFVPLWMAIGTRTGMRALWFASALLGIATIAVFAGMGRANVSTTQLFLVVMQAALVGFNLVFWAMLPDTVEYGEHRVGVRVEALGFGVSALVQKFAFGIAAGLMGVVYQLAGYQPDAVQTPETVAGIRWVMLLMPALCFALSALVMWANPLRRGAHAAIVADLAARPKGD
ncbi:glycoside-pentoside-hexuronide (GPH):cation symporter [Sphingomonas sp. PL-96]|uniref:MFS transporter n=1 Tax=Sphingomonas sp. PL-96 TaxID=2887201 RepID=UPI001E4CDA01|nr:glycoside-pentoside-hexuronide (GPH):cation symporter [Sphingomonas sp. PL-96]MCC2976502.1 glycoside-pentoside-hexuronide (GPH):cation symporter [Sphingomonas sp. PL-96]